ncbi:acyclic terpene utilization AtuA family protein [Algiphilus sp. W345]|uniref:Acyclic terpene utilization AtuA family protein n=1 Tax=Banduia mediterranea TaxID=3075609 RepID=A0ABU2WEX2_9GAMM|nr:acyclic terpene utilization AtuA family protein [Algiphilus sp. W345]MDT0496414.1 acyclic terpene utilization AtuA family protein [Algiphilus sp. W345]
MTRTSLRIGCASGFWGDTEYAATQLVHGGKLDFLVFDYLAEITMSLLTRAKAKDPAAGYAPDFVTTLRPLLRQLKERGIRVVSNAGGVNPGACRQALAEAARAEGLTLKIAAVTGDDLMPQVEAMRAAGVREMFSGADLPARLMSANAYLGAFPIAAALDAGADIVVTGRCVDSAVVLGPLISAFGWESTDYDRLAQGSLAGHIIECGTQTTGGNYTDWHRVPGWDNMGFPIAVCEPDGSFVVEKPPGTGGLIVPSTVGEQMVYEIGDPRAYLLPDVRCDFTQVRLEQAGDNRVRVSGARGGPATTQCKVSATYADGFRAIAMLMIGGVDAQQKGERVAEALYTRCRRLFAERGLDDFTETCTEVLGAEATYGPHARAVTREVMVKMGVRHSSKDALEIFSREMAPMALATAPAITGFVGGRPKVQPVVRLFSYLWDKSRIPVRLELDGQAIACPQMSGERYDPATLPVVSGPLPAADAFEGGSREVPLLRLAWARSGDKGDSANIGVLARRPEYLPYIRAALTPEAVAGWFAHLCEGPVHRWDMPGVHGLNFLLERALGGGGIASIRIDPQGKAFAQMLLDHPVMVPASLSFE